MKGYSGIYGENPMNNSSHAVKAIIFNHEHKILLLQRNPRHASDVDNWDLPGGLVDIGEDEKAALIRELKEELDVTAHIISKSGNWHFTRRGDSKKISAQNYICKIQGNIRLSQVHKNQAWIDPHEIRRYKFKDESLYSAIEGLKR